MRRHNPTVNDRQLVTLYQNVEETEAHFNISQTSSKDKLVYGWLSKSSDMRRLGIADQKSSTRPCPEQAETRSSISDDGAAGRVKYSRLSWQTKKKDINMEIHQFNIAEV